MEKKGQQIRTQEEHMNAPLSHTHTHKLYFWYSTMHFMNAPENYMMIVGVRETEYNHI